MVMRRTDSVKRKRKEGCSSPLLDDSPKRTKVHAQRKFAQGSNVNSPVITPVKEIESERSPINVLPEPVELLPIKRPNTEDFLTFLCFRGTPILPPSLNFFNTASIVDTNGQVHEIKSESPKNGPIDTSVITKCGSSTEKPFIAYGVRKRADPIVISKQMDRKRRHALAIQALRRKYQEQKMAKIRALTISKLSEKVTNRTLVRTNSLTKTEPIPKKTNTTNTVEKPKVVATKPIKVTTQTIKTSLRPKKMCLRSFRGRFVQRELQFRPGKKRPIIDKKSVDKKCETKTEKESNSEESEYSSDDNQPLSTPGTSNRVVTRQTAKVIKKPTHLATRSTTLGSRVTRSGHLINKLDVRRQQIKKRILLTNTQTIIKPRSLRSTTIRKTVLPQRPNTASLKLKQVQKKPVANKEEVPATKTIKNPIKPSQQLKADVKKLSVTVHKSVDVKKEINKTELKKELIAEVKKELKSNENKKDSKKEPSKLVEVKKEVKATGYDADLKKDVEKSKTPTDNTKNVSKDVQTRRSGNKMKLKEVEESLSTEESETFQKKVVKKENPVTKKEACKSGNETKEESPQRSREKASISPPRSARPSRKTKEAAAIYMELLSQKLVHDSKLDDDDSNSIDSFPELPNVKRTEQRENELKAQAKKSDTGRRRSKTSEKKESASTSNVNKKNTIESDDEEIKKTPKRKSNSQEKEQTDVKKTKLIKNDELKSSSKKNSDEKKSDSTETKRQTRNSSHNIKVAEESEDSDESFHADIKIPRQKKVTRSSTTPKPKLDSEDEELKQLIKKVQEETSTESDYSSSTNSKSKSIKSKTKKYSKTKSKQNTDTNFSDSDEEPLSKLTTKNTENSQKSSEVDGKSRGNVETRRSAKANTETQINQSTKPKRECAKRPQNYLPMFSSTDEDDEYLEELKKVEVKPHKLPIEKPVSDLLSKDIKRRFGKEKVNMSNEQIEKWLKESAMAGNEVKSENDAMLKFGECIPTETTLETNEHEHIDTAKLKSSLLSDVKSESSTQSTINKDKQKLKLDIKPHTIDRKLIFKKVKKEPAPNLNAFSPENESSVYAFGEENETPSTPFRRPSRRPSSTATSRSEDESSKVEEYFKVAQFRKPPAKQESEKCKEEVEEEQLPHFNMPHKPSKKTDGPCGSRAQKLARSALNFDVPEEVKYKVPSSPSASSSSSAKLSKKQTVKQEMRMPMPVHDFPAKSAPAQLVEAPIFYPNEQEFQDPIEYIERIRAKAEQFGICKIVPPNSFKPECKVSDDMRFTAYNQYVQKMLHRWGPNFKELMAIKKYLETQNISLAHPPWIGGMEIDLPRLYQTVQSLGGLKEVIEKKKWPRVSECMKIPKSAQDRVTKLDDIYCKYLLPYDTLSPAEREKLFDEVETDWAKRESKTLIKAQQTVTSDDEEEEESESDDEAEECIVKGRNMALNAFYRIARNTMSMYFKTAEPPAEEVEEEFWRHVSQRQNHICVHSGSIDSGSWGYGFSVSKNSPFARHAWNLKVLTNNSGSVLRSMGPIMGVTVPTLHVGMVFSACCWYRDPHALPWVEYLHTGGSKIWYGLPDSSTDLFHVTMKKLVPNFCRNKNLWLPSDTAMVPPSLLVENNVSLCRVVQEPGQFIVVFPKAFTSSISTGYVVSESVYFATPNWLKTARGVFDDLKKSCEPSMFSLERLILSITTDSRSNVDVLRQILPSVQGICDNEKLMRDKLKTFGVMEHEKLPLPEAPNARRRRKVQEDDGDYECEICRKNLFVSMVFDADGDVVYCLEHAIKMLEEKRITLSKCKLMFTYDYNELDGLVERIHATIEMKMQKKIPNKYSGMPTLLTK